MNPERAAGWVRRWVALYTRGLPADRQQDRRDEIDDDLWTQAHDAAESGRTDRSLSGEIVFRLMFGIPADVSWRIEQNRLANTRPLPERHPTNGTRAVALLAIAGGIGWVVWPIPQAVYGEAAWTISPLAWLLFVSVVLGTWALAGAMFVLVIGLQDRIGEGVALLGSLGAAIGAVSVLGLFAGIVALPVGSAVLMWELGRVGVLGTSLSRVHVATAILALIVFVVFLANIAILSDEAIAIVLLALVLPYAFSWIAIGRSLRHGVPVPERPAKGA